MFKSHVPLNIVECSVCTRHIHEDSIPQRDRIRELAFKLRIRKEKDFYTSGGFSAIVLIL